MQRIIRSLTFSLVAGAIALVTSMSAAHAASYTDWAGVQTVQATDGKIWTIFQAGGFEWGIPSTDPGFAAYTTVLTGAWVKSKHIQVGCVSCTATQLTSPGLTGTWTVWYPQWITPMAN